VPVGRVGPYSRADLRPSRGRCRLGPGRSHELARAGAGGRNVEVKVAVRSLRAVRAAVQAIGGEDGGDLRQVDTYFWTGSRIRLKLREQDPGGAELIAYLRADSPGSRISDYRRWPVPDATGLRRVLGLALGVRARIAKRRRLYAIGRTRIHLDDVRGLGRFVELEVVLGPGQSAANGRREAERVLRGLGLGEHRRIPGSYADL